MLLERIITCLFLTPTIIRNEQQQTNHAAVSVSKQRILSRKQSARPLAHISFNCENNTIRECIDTSE
jgi:hypothetical protein